MTKPRYPLGCAAGSKAAGIAAPDPAYRWCVNFNNGNTNELNSNNTAFARAVRAGECHGAVTFAALYAAFEKAARGKRPSVDRMAFESDWIDGIYDLLDRVVDYTWSPAPPSCFVARAPKAREIHAPAFADRVLHHWLMPYLEPLYERIFIHDSYANRRGKGSHAAVAQLRSFVRQVHDGQGGGWYLQLDIRNYFNELDRRILYALLKPRTERAGLPLVVRRAVHALIRRPAGHAGVRYVGRPFERDLVPAHKRLENARPGCGIAIGNLSSQFFANVYLHELDVFVKHELRARRYLRYVDDFVLVHRDRAQMQAWQAAIASFLAERLGLELKPGAEPRPLSAGIDFLGYVVYPRRTVVRRRVIGHARAKLAALERAHVRRGGLPRGREARRAMRAVWDSYQGHFRHANSRRLVARFHQRFPWLEQLV